MPRRTWTDDDLIEAIAASRTWSEVLRRLGLRDRGNVRDQLRAVAERLGVSRAHLERRERRRWADAELVDAVARATNLHGGFRELGLRVGGGAWVTTGT